MQISNLVHDIHIKLRKLQQKSIKSNNVTYLSNIGHTNDCYKTATTNGAGTAYPSEHPRFQWGSCSSILSFMCMFCRSLFVLLYFFFWPMCCLFFFDIRILITPLVSSNSSYNEFLQTLHLSSLRFHFPVAVEALMVHKKSVRSTQMTSGLSKN